MGCSDHDCDLWQNKQKLCFIETVMQVHTDPDSLVIPDDVVNQLKQGHLVNIP